jgi:citronellol/citronellal dehydrogenase
MLPPDEGTYEIASDFLRPSPRRKRPYPKTPSDSKSSRRRAGADIVPRMANPFAPGLFDGQVAIVTGGGTGIGRAAALELAQLGAKVVIASRKPEHLDPTVEELRAQGEAIALPCDIREPSQIEQLVTQVLDRFGAIDVLVNNAGGQFPSPALALTPKGWDAVVRNNLNGTFYLTREVATRAMLPRGRGSIVNVTVSLDRGFPGMAHTGAARAGVHSLTQSLAIEWAQSGVRVNAVAPGLITSTGTAQYPPDLTRIMTARVPNKRAGTVEECAHAIVFLASPAASYVSGAVLQVDGGASPWGGSLPF